MVKATFQPLTSIYNIAIMSTTLTSSTLITTFSQKSFDLRLRRPERKILFAGLTLLTSFFRNYGGDLFLEAMSLGRDVVQKKSWIGLKSKIQENIVMYKHNLYYANLKDNLNES